MHLIIGGRSMGKLDWAKSLAPDAAVCDLAQDSPEAIRGAGIVRNIHLLIRDIVLRGQDAAAFIGQYGPLLEGKLVIGDEVGCGVVPVEAAERLWRDETGRVYQHLAGRAARVTRVWAGLPQEIGRNGLQL